MKIKTLILMSMVLLGMIGISSADIVAVNINSPSNDTWYSGRNMVVVFNATTNASTTFNCTIEFNHTNYYSGTGISNNTETITTLSWITAEMTQGLLNVSCTDQWETLSSIHNISTDFTTPNIFNLSVNATNNRVNHANASINLTIEYIETNMDYITASANYTYDINNYTLASGNASLTTNWTKLGCLVSASSCRVRIRIADSADIRAWDSITLYLDTTSPAVSGISWSDTDLISNSTNNYVFSLTYNVSWLSSVSISNITGNGSTAMSCSAGSCTLTDNLSEYGCSTDGACVINVTLIDVFGVIDEDNMTITIDNTTPVINETIISNESNNWFEYGDSIFFRLNVSDSNILMCYLEDNNMSNGTIGLGLTQRWNYTSTNIKDCSGNCTYCNLTGYCIDKADNRVDFGIGITIIPCVETTDATISSTSATLNALSITLDDGTVSTTNIWMVPQSYNSTFGQCNYNVSNAQNFTIHNATINLTYTAHTARCNISIVRDTTDTGVIEVSVHTGLSQTQPSSIPTAALAALALILIFTHLAATKTST